jgi:hypothetical protein
MIGSLSNSENAKLDFACELLENGLDVCNRENWVRGRLWRKPMDVNDRDCRVGYLSARLELVYLPGLCANCQKREDSVLRDSDKRCGRREADLEDAELARAIINLVDELGFER